MRTMLRQDTSGDSRAESKEPALRTSGQAGRPSFVRVNPFVPQGKPALRTTTPQFKSAGFEGPRYINPTGQKQRQDAGLKPGATKATASGRRGSEAPSTLGRGGGLSF